MMQTFAEIVKRAESLSPITVAVAAAADQDVLEAVLAAQKRGIAKFRLYGDEREMQKLGQQVGLVSDGITLRHAETDGEACQSAVAAVHQGEADVVMKGMVQTADFLRAILHKETGLRAKKMLSHVATFEVPGFDRLLHVTDPALNISPTLPEKKEIVENVIPFCHSLGNRQPKVAALAAVEVVNPSMPATLDAAALAQMNRRNQIKQATIDGPFALDNAISIESAHHKGIHSPVAGVADVLLVPDIEAGNILYKSMVYFAKSKMGGLVLGARCPIILTSRTDSPEAKLHSIVLAILQAAFQKNSDRK
jgi:phosphate butyryltransferase